MDDHPRTASSSATSGVPMKDRPPQSDSWLWLLVPPLLAYQSPSINGYSFDAQYFLVPIAALLGARFGLAGCFAIAIGGLTFVVDISGYSWGSTGGNPSLYLIAMGVSALSTAMRDGGTSLAWPRSERSLARITFAAPLLLVLSLMVGHTLEPGRSGLRLIFFFAPALLGYVAILAMAARGAKLWPLLAGLAVTMCITWPLTLIGVFPGERTPIALNVGALQPVAIVAALACFAAGTSLKRSLRQPVAWSFWRWPYASAVVLLIVWLGPEPLAYITLPLRGGSELWLMGCSVLLPLTAFMLGLLRGYRGGFIVAGIVVLMLLLGRLLNDASINLFRVHHVPLEAPFVALAYAMLGAYLRTEPYAQSKWGLPRATTVFLLGVGATLDIVGDGGTVRIALGSIFAIFFFALYITAIWARWAALRKSVDITAESWMSLATIVSLIVLVGFYGKDVFIKLAQLLMGLVLVVVTVFKGAEGADPIEAIQNGGLNGGILVLSVAFFVAIVFGSISAIKKAVMDCRGIYKDIRTIKRYWRLILAGRSKISS